MEDPRIRKFAQFLIRSAVELQKGEKILIELHGSETGLMKALVQEAYAVGGKPFIHIFDYGVEGALVPVSYTHLDVYKRQLMPSAAGFAGTGRVL